MERRREQRLPASGPVELWIERPEGGNVVGELVDISPSGFRIRHSDLSIRTGMRVRYSHSAGSGAALVAWTRVVGQQVESGFYIPGAG